MNEKAENDRAAIAPTGGAYPLAGAIAAEDAEHLSAAARVDEPDSVPPVRGGWIFFLVIASFGTMFAFVTPLAISLAIRVNTIAPGDQEYLGVILGIGALAALLVGPLGGQLSDRTRTRLGRRRPWIVGGVIVGVLGLAILGVSTAVWGLILGWVVAQLGFSQAVANLIALQADKLPESQRGKVAGLTGVANMSASIFGAVIASPLAGMPVAMFLLPGVVAIVFVLPLLCLAREGDSRQLVVPPMTVRSVITKYVYDPRKYADFSWNWLGRFLFYFGLTIGSTYTAFFFAARLGIDVANVGGVIAIASLIGVVGTMGGALGGGFLSDKVRRRKPFVAAAGVIFAIGAVITGLAPDLTLLIVGSFLTSLGIGIFSAVDQALLLDILPERDTDAARFISIIQFAVGIPQAIAPIVASALLAIGLGAAAGGANYTVLYMIAGAFTVLGGLVILRVRGAR